MTVEGSNNTSPTRRRILNTRPEAFTTGSIIKASPGDVPVIETSTKITALPYNKEKYQDERRYAAKKRTQAREANQQNEGLAHIFNENSIHAFCD